MHNAHAFDLFLPPSQPIEMSKLRAAAACQDAMRPHIWEILGRATGGGPPSSKLRAHAREWLPHMHGVLRICERKSSLREPAGSRWLPSNGVG